jgi:hypothetical protein
VVDVVVSGLAMIAAIYDEGVFLSWDAGVTWEPMNDGLTDFKITSLAQAGRKLYAGVENGGIWEFPAEFAGDGVAEESAPDPILLSIQPNPVTEHVTMNYRLVNRSMVSVTIHDALGRIVSQPVVDVIQESGEHRVVMDAEGLAAGAYHCSISAGNDLRRAGFVILR